MFGEVVAVEPGAVVGLDQLQPRLKMLGERHAAIIQMIENTEAHRLSLATSLTASVIGNSYCLADRRVATRASREGPGESDDEASPHGRDRVWDVALGSVAPLRRYCREWQIARTAQRRTV